ncbi:MAG: PD-(D/E)XK nuclease family protein, partial [Mariprofundales bacterium]
VKCGFLIKDGTEPDAAAKAAQVFADDLDGWLRRDRLPIDDKVSTAVIVRAIKRLQHHLARIQHQVPMAAVAMGHCRDLAMILSDMGEIEKSLLDRIVDDVIGPCRGATSVREAASWGVIGAPGQLCGTVETLIWWGFHDCSSAAANIWTNHERAWLQQGGVALDAPSLARARERHHWLGSLQRCKKMLLCRLSSHGGRPTLLHPLWSEMQCRPAMQQRSQELSALALLQQRRPALLGKSLSLVQSKPIAIPTVSAEKTFKKGAFKNPDKLSPTSLGSLFGCSLKWLLEQMNISASKMMTIDSGSTMIGTLAHQVLEDVFAQGVVPDPDAASRAAELSFDRRVQEMAAELLLPEQLVERDKVRSKVVMAAGDLAVRFKQASFTRLVCEQWIHTTLAGITVNGRADVIAYNDSDVPLVIDFKYSFARNYYENKIREGRDIQLITYSRMIDNKPRPVAYYLIPIERMVTVFPEFAADTVEMEDAIDEGWQRIEVSFGVAMTELRAGRALASGLVDETELEEARKVQGVMYESPPCRFCDYSVLCGKNGGGNHA